MEVSVADYLVVVRAFGVFSVGDVIEGEGVEEVLGGEHSGCVVRVIWGGK